MTIIHESTFEGCESLVDITLPSTTQVIEAHAFAGCKSLKRLTLPASLQTLGPGALSKCKSLQVVTFLTSDDDDENDNDKNENETTRKKHLGDMNIRDNAFDHCPSLVLIELK